MIEDSRRTRIAALCQCNGGIARTWLGMPRFGRAVYGKSPISQQNPPSLGRLLKGVINPMKNVAALTDKSGPSGLKCTTLRCLVALLRNGEWISAQLVSSRCSWLASEGRAAKPLRSTIILLRSIRRLERIPLPQGRRTGPFRQLIPITMDRSSVHFMVRQLG